MIQSQLCTKGKITESDKPLRGLETALNLVGSTLYAGSLVQLINVSDALTKRNIALFKSLNEICISGILHIEKDVGLN